MKYIHYKKIDNSDPKLPSRHIKRELVVLPVRVTLSHYWESWVFSFYIFFVGFCVATMGVGSYGLRFFNYGISFRVPGYELDIGFHSLGYLMWKTRRIVNKDPELKQMLRKVRDDVA